jgi:hypothetical protein
MNMAILNVEVSDNIAKKFNKLKVINWEKLYDEMDKEIWSSVKVGENAEDVLDKGSFYAWK